ncbi:MAG: hypothetical protein HY000_33850 [Planctomycetes bacterium]|nr:hypothetical protein [Planctomycetota bacterium]
MLQLPRLLERPGQASPSMVRAAVLEQASALEQTDLASVLDARRQLGFVILLAAELLLPAAFCLLFPSTAGLWAQRWLFGSNVRWPQAIYLAVVGLDGDRMLAPRGEPLVLQLVAKPESRNVPDQVGLRYWPQGGASKRASFVKFGDNDFRYELRPVQEPLEFSVVGGDDWLGPIRVEPIDRPSIEDITLVARDPRGQTRTFHGGDSQLLFLPSTGLELQVTSRVPLQDASLAAKTGTAPAFERLDARTYTSRWTMSEALALEIRLTGEVGSLNSRPYELSIGLLKDREPRVTVRSTGVGPRVTAVAHIPLVVRATDDFGLTQLAMEWQRIVPTEQESASKDEPERITLEPAPADAPTEDERQTQVDLREFTLTTGTTLKLRGTAQDNCAEGSQSGLSRWLSFRVVTPEELFHEILMRQRAERTKFRAALTTAKSQTRAFDTAVEPDAVDGLLRKHQVVERQVWQIANRLDESLTEMKLNSLGSPQALDLLQSQVITPMRQLHNDQMAGLRKMLDHMAVEKASLEPLLPDARDLQQQIVETMQRILEQMSQWESFVDVVNQLREIMKLQGRVLDSTDEMRKKRTKGVFDE